MTGNGVLALWKDCATGFETLFEEWYQTEHMKERLAVSGFLRGRRYEAINASSMFFTWYEVESPDVLQSTEYLDRLGDPTPMTSEIMSKAMKNMSRTVCNRYPVYDEAFGAIAVTVKLSTGDLDQANHIDQLSEIASTLGSATTLARSEVWIKNAEANTSNPSKEEVLRGGDAQIDACLLLEFLRLDSAEAAATASRKSFPSADIGLYRLLCERVN